MTDRKPPNLKEQKQLVEAWNASHPAGTLVTVEMDDGSKFQTKTEGEAIVLANGIAVIWVRGISGCYKLDRVKPATDDLDPELVRAELVRMFPNSPVGICKVEVWTCGHTNTHRADWDIVIGSDHFAISSLIGAVADEDIKFPTLREAFEAAKDWKRDRDRSAGH